VCGLSDRYTEASAAIDAANSADPTSVVVRGSAQPLAFVHGRIAVEWVHHLQRAPSELLLLAARAHHLRRWELPRSEYPEGKAGYLRWKRDQRQRHARDIAELLAPFGYSADEIASVQRWVRRDDLATDAGSQTVEDAACLVFIETQLADVATKLEHDHLIEVIRKTARKMSADALALAARVPLEDHARALLLEALA
jgi:hypothetical protein